MQQIVLIIHVLVAIGLIALVLIQHGKGADIGAAFGSGASQTVFGSQGSGGFLFKLTATLAVIFFVTSLTLTRMAAHAPQAAANSMFSVPAQTTKKQSNEVPGLPGSTKGQVNLNTQPAQKTGENKK